VCHMYLGTCRRAGGDSDERKGRPANHSLPSWAAREANHLSGSPGWPGGRVADGRWQVEYLEPALVFASCASMYIDVKVHGGNAEESGDSTAKRHCLPHP
jgi:hypothetical protein